MHTWFFMLDKYETTIATCIPSDLSVFKKYIECIGYSTYTNMHWTLAMWIWDTSIHMCSWLLPVWGVTSLFCIFHEFPSTSCHVENRVRLHAYKFLPVLDIWRSRRHFGWKARRATGTQTWTPAQSQPRGPTPTLLGTSGTGMYCGKRQGEKKIQRKLLKAADKKGAPRQGLSWDLRWYQYKNLDTKFIKQCGTSPVWCKETLRSYKHWRQQCQCI